MFNEEKEPAAAVPAANDWDRLAYDVLCRCDDTRGDFPWCKACYPDAPIDIPLPPEYGRIRTDEVREFLTGADSDV
jgi:hypothetical protein